MFVNTLATLPLFGLYARFIEPSWLEETRFSVKIPHLPASFQGTKVLHISDLHFSLKATKAHKKAASLVSKLRPDLIVFTGDFLCYAQLRDPKELEDYLHVFQAPLGSYAVLGNHDYASYVSFGPQGKGVLLDKKLSLLSRFQKPHPVPQNLPANPVLEDLLTRTPFKLLHNESRIIKRGDDRLNIAGVGDWYAEDTKPEKAFASWDKSLPGLVLCHNPMSSQVLSSYPGDLLLAGHTHGSQINIPLLRNLLLQNKALRRGLVAVGDKQLFISRGMGSHIRFRLFSRPEATLITLTKAT